MRPPLYKHQKEHLEKYGDASRHALFWQMGTAKSRTCIETMAHLYRHGKIASVLVFANKGSFRNWPDIEIPKWAPDDMEYVCMAWQPLLTKKYSQELGQFIKDPLPVLKIFVMNIEALSTPKGTKAAKLFLYHSAPSLTIFDESTTLKNPKAQRTRNAMEVNEGVAYSRILTGSPIANSPLNVYSQVKVLGKGLLPFSNYFTFRARFAVMKVMNGNGRSFQQVVGYRNLEDLMTMVKPFSSILKKEDCLDLPEKTYQEYLVELSPEQARHYKALKDHAFTVLDKETVVPAPVAMTQLLRLHQVVCGHLPQEDGKPIRLPENRTAALLNVLEESSEKAIIFANYVADIEHIQKVLGKEYGQDKIAAYYGATSADDRSRIVKEFQEGDLRYIVGNRVMAHGLTLTAASTMIFYSNDYDLEIRMQVEDRLHRPGQKNVCTYVDLVSRKTVDEKIIKVLKKKQNLSDFFMDWKGLIE